MPVDVENFSILYSDRIYNICTYVYKLQSETPFKVASGVVLKNNLPLEANVHKSAMRQFAHFTGGNVCGEWLLGYLWL